MRAEIVDHFGRQEHNLQIIKPRLRIVLYVQNLQENREARRMRMRSVIRFLNARNMKPADIHRQLCEVCGEHVMNDSRGRDG
jgi:hypothetical protein